MVSVNPPVIGVTIGDPAGIGPEIVLKAVAGKGLARADSMIAAILAAGDLVRRIHVTQKSQT